MTALWLVALLLPLALGVVLARRLPRLVGPMFRPELRRWTNRKPPHRNRLVVLLLLFGALYLLYQDAFPGAAATAPLSEAARFAEWFVFTVLAVQLVVVTALIPPAVASSVIEEKERRSLDLLLLTELSPREIVLGKLAARLVPAFDVILAGLPLVALTQLWGGVDMTRVVLGYGVCLTAAVSLGAWSMACAAAGDSLRKALLGAWAPLPYLWLCCIPFGPVGALTSPFAFLSWLFVGGRGIFGMPGEPDQWYVAFGIHVLLAAVLVTVCTRGAARALRRFPAREGVASAIPSPAQPPTPPEQPPAFLRPRVPLDRDPLVWREEFASGDARLIFAGVVTFLGWIMGAFFLLGGLVVFLTHGTGSVKELLRNDRPWTPIRGLARVYGGLVLLAGVISAGLQAAGTVTREREKRTLVGLILLPIDRSEILRAKYRASLDVGRTCWFCLAMMVVPASLTAIHPVSGLVLLIFAWLLGSAAARVGVCVSVLFKTTGRATIFFLLIALAACLPWAGYPITPHLLRGSELGETLPELWWKAVMGWGEASRTCWFYFLTGNGALVVAGVYWLLAMAAWWITCRIFERVPER